MSKVRGPKSRLNYNLNLHKNSNNCQQNETKTKHIKNETTQKTKNMTSAQKKQLPDLEFCVKNILKNKQNSKS